MSDSLSWADYRYRVSAARLVTPVIRELTLAPLGDPVPYAPGQYVLLGDADWRVPQRSFSLAGAPRADGVVTILVTLVAGGATSAWAHGLTIDDEVLLEGPFGTFVTAPGRTSPVLLLAAGSGLAPCRALAEFLLADTDRRVTLFFSGRTTEHLIDDDVFTDQARRHDRLTYLTTCTRMADDPTRRRPRSRIPLILGEHLPDLTGWEVFTAGPSGFVTGCAAAAEKLRANAADIHTEEFFSDPTPWTDLAPQAPAPYSEESL